MNLPIDRPLIPGKATDFIRAVARGNPNILPTAHSKEQMSERDLIMGDVMYVLKYGFVYKDGEPSTQAGLFKYNMECSTPNSNGRNVSVTTIPSKENKLKIVTVMWVDEARVKG